MVEMDVPGPRSAEQRSAGDPIPIARLLPKPVYFVMAGGGAHGAVQWGALQALSQSDVVPDAIIGTSAGALTGAILAEDLASGVHRIAYIWSQINRSYLVGEKWLSPHRLSAVRSPGLLAHDTQEQTLASILHTTNIEDLEVDFAAVATDLATGRPHLFTEGPLIPALLASSAIPGVLPPVTLGDGVYIDGLASANLPAIPAIQRGAGSIVVLDTGTRKVKEVDPAPAKVISRVAVIMAASQRRRQLREAAHEVPVLLLPTPDDLAGTLEFGDTMRAAAAGYSLSRSFLADLALQKRRKLSRGLYARPDDHALTPDLEPLLKAVPR